MRLPFTDLEDAGSHVGEDWEKLRGARLLLTGGTGFVGRWLVESFSHANDSRRLGAEMCVVSRDPAAVRAAAPHLAADKGIRLVLADLKSQEFLAGDRSRYDFVIHAATASSRELEDGGHRAVAAEVASTRRLLEKAAADGSRRFLYLSSGAIYGRQPADLSGLPEDFETGDARGTGKSAYADAKRESERLCVEIASESGFDAVIARGFAFVGPLLPLGSKFAAGSFLEDALEGRTIRVSGDGTPIRSYLYAGDLAAWLWILLFRGRPGRSYNIGSETEISIRSLANEIASLSVPPRPVEVVGSADPPNPADRYVPSTERARRELDVAEWTALPEALRRTYRWYRAALPERRQAAAR